MTILKQPDPKYQNKVNNYIRTFKIQDTDDTNYYPHWNWSSVDEKTLVMITKVEWLWKYLWSHYGPHSDDYIIDLMKAGVTMKTLPIITVLYLKASDRPDRYGSPVIDGNHRLRASRKLGYTAIPLAVVFDEKMYENIYKD